MKTINCRIKLNDHQDVSGVDVTPAEVIVLRHMHDKHAGGCCIKKPRASGEALMEVPPENEDDDTTYRARTSEEEYWRLRQKYPQRSAPDKPDSSFLDDLFPGVLTGGAQLPTSFEDLPKKYALPDAIAPAKEKFVRTPEVAKARPIGSTEAAEQQAKAKNPRKGKEQPKDVVPEAGTGEPEGEQGPGGPQEDLSGKKVAELRAIAGDYDLKLSGKETKAQLIALIQAQQPTQPAATEPVTS